MICNTCGAQMKEKEKVCPYCGAPNAHQVPPKVYDAAKTAQAPGGLIRMSSAWAVILLVGSLCTMDVIAIVLAVLALVYVQKANLCYDQGQQDMAISLQRTAKTLLWVGWILFLLWPILSFAIFGSVIIGILASL